MNIKIEDILIKLGKYRELQLKYTEGNFTGAGQLLVNLLKSGTVPKKYMKFYMSIQHYIMGFHPGIYVSELTLYLRDSGGLAYSGHFLESLGLRTSSCIRVPFIIL